MTKVACVVWALPKLFAVTSVSVVGESRHWPRSMLSAATVASTVDRIARELCVV
jgi:hypothetical protein